MMMPADRRGIHQQRLILLLDKNLGKFVNNLVVLCLRLPLCWESPLPEPRNTRFHRFSSRVSGHVPSCLDIKVKAIDSVGTSVFVLMSRCQLAIY